MATLHVHIDESGNFLFSPKGTRYYIFTVAWTLNPKPLAEQLSMLRLQLIKDGLFRDDQVVDLSGFHACDDPTPRKEAVVSTVLRHRDWNFASIVIEKNRVNPSLYEPSRFYPKFLTYLLNFVLRGRVGNSVNTVLIYTDTLPMKSRAESKTVNKTIVDACRAELKGRTFRVCHHTSDSNYWLQIADYCSWAVNRKWEFGDTRFYDLLRPRLATLEADPMSKGNGKTYYEHPNKV